MGTYCAPPVTDLFFVCYERYFMLSLTITKLMLLTHFNSGSRYLDDLHNIDNPYFKQMESQIYPNELQLNKAKSFNTESSFMDVDFSTANGIVSSIIYDK